MKDILLFSGGLDSFIAWEYLKRPPALYVAIGHRYQPREVDSVLEVSFQTGMDVRIDKRLHLGDLEREDAFIPMRNHLLVSVAALHGNRIWLTVQKGELELPDRSPRFAFLSEKLLTLLGGGGKYVVDSPFWDVTKTEMVAWYLAAGHNPELLSLTVSCYSGSGFCGECPSCFRRWVAMYNNGIEENYRQPPWKTLLAKRYLDKAVSGKYGTERGREIIQALKKVGVSP